MADAPDHDPDACMACRGTGRVVSNLGGDGHEVPCPWCEGSGRKPAPEHDAQAQAPADPAGSRSDASE
jgi:DnaJ-class molecular chaperone